MAKRGNPALQRGAILNPKGRTKGTQNEMTKDIKEAFKNLVECNLENMTKWLERVAKDDPKNALDMVIKLSERFVPALSRTEITGKDGDALSFTNALKTLKQNI